MEKCNRSNIAAGGGMQARGTAQAVRALYRRLPQGGRRQSEVAYMDKTPAGLPAAGVLAVVYCQGCPA